MKQERQEWLVAYRMPREKVHYIRCRTRQEARRVRKSFELEAYDTALYRLDKQTGKWKRYKDA